MFFASLYSGKLHDGFIICKRMHGGSIEMHLVLVGPLETLLHYWIVTSVQC
jgi:hypothetical protein